MKKGWRNIVISMLLVSLTTGPLFFGFTQKAEANSAGCLAGIATALGIGKSKVVAAKALGVKGKIIAVPTFDGANEAIANANADINANTSAQTQGFTIQRCIVEPLVIIMVRSLLNTFTAQTISWINSGFKGSPLYVTNPQGFLNDIADQTIGQYIDSLGGIGSIVCGPFDLQLRLSLNLEFGAGGGYQQEIGCRLSDIQQNVQRAFTGGSFGSNGWNNWIQLTSVPQNNIYGAYLKASNSLDVAIAGRQIINLEQIAWGKGFLSSVDPETGEISTPGSLIEDQLSNTLGEEVRRVGLAKDIDAILGALVNQLINQVMGAAGLGGASKRPSGGGPSAVERARNSNPETYITDNTRTQALPLGVLPDSATTADKKAFCAQVQLNLYFRDRTTGSVWYQPGTRGADNNITYGEAQVTKKQILLGGSIPWSVEDYNSVVSYCNSVAVTSAITDSSQSYTDQFKPGPEDATATPTITTQTNLALRKTAEQSSTCRGSVGVGNTGSADNAVNGQTQSSFFFGIASTCQESVNWWQVDLGEENPIGKIKIYKTSTAGTDGREERSGYDMGYAFSVIVTKTNPGKDEELKSLTSKNPSVVFRKDYTSLAGLSLEIPVNLNGRYVRIQSEKGLVSTAEVEVYPPTATESKNTPSISLTSSTPKDTPIVLSDKFSLTLTALPKQDQFNLKTRFKLVTYDTVKKGPSGNALPWSTAFRTLDIKVENSSGLTIRSVDILQGGADASCISSPCQISVSPSLAENPPTNIVTWENTFSLSANLPLTFTFNGIKASTATPGQYVLVTEILNASDVVISSQEETFTLR